MAGLQLSLIPVLYWRVSGRQTSGLYAEDSSSCALESGLGRAVVVAMGCGDCSCSVDR